MPSDFAQNFLAGAQVGNMMAQRRERSIQLRQEQALQAIKERQLAAEAAMWEQHAQLYKQQAAAEAQTKLDLKTAYDAFQLYRQTMPEEDARAKADAVLEYKNPKAMELVAKSRKEQQPSAQLMQQQKDQKDLATYRQKYLYSTEVDNLPLDQSKANADKWLTANNPELALKKAQAENEQRKAPGTDTFATAYNKYKDALAEGDDESAKIWLGRVQKLSGQLPTNALRESEDFATIKSKLDEMEEDPNADPSEKQKLRDKVNYMESLHGQEEITVDTPGGPQVRIVKGGKREEPGALTKPEITRYGEDHTASENSLRNLNRLRGQLNSGVVGAKAKIESFMLDEVLGQFDPDVVNKARVAARQNIGLATQQVLGELNNRGRFSNQELQAVKDAMPSLGYAESDPRSKVKVDELSLMLAEKGASAAVKIKRPVGDTILQTLSKLFPPGAAGERAMANEVRSGALDSSVAMQVRKWQKTKGL